jgi:osmotically-inducible protein OsmY
MTDTREMHSYLVERVRTALASDPRVNELGIAVTVVERKVFLRGTVATPARQAGIATVVRELLPEHEIHNDVRVEEPAAATEPETLR